MLLRVECSFQRNTKKFPKITHKQVQEFLAEQDAYTLHYQVRRRFPRNKIISAGLDSDWQADLMDLRPLKKYNNDRAYILVCIDVFSHFAWVESLKTKAPEEVANAFDSILKSGRKCWILCTDRGKEFMGKAFQEFLYKKQIKHFAATSPDVKAALAERYIRTFKTRLWKYFTQKGTYHYLDFLPKLVHAINNSYHRIIKCAPAQVNAENEREIWHQLYGRSKDKTAVKFKFKINDTVRIS